MMSLKQTKDKIEPQVTDKCGNHGHTQGIDSTFTLSQNGSNHASLKTYLQGTTLWHATSLRQAYDTNCFV